MRTLVAIATRDGTCPTHVFQPEGAGPWPGVLFYMDALGPRPSLFAMAERMAAAGYLVLLPDLLYRAGAYEPPTAAIFADPPRRKHFFETYVATANIANVMSDTAALLDYLAARPDVKQPLVGTTGYCMGGSRSLAAAGTYPDRVAVAASYHASNVATDAPDSPHRLAPRMKARVYVAGASDDAGFDDAQKARLERALTEAGVVHTVETYAARHGFVPADMPTHDDAAEARHWTTLLELLATLR